MTKMTNTRNEDRQFIVVMRGPSAVLFRQDTNMLVEDFPSSAGPVNIVYTTRWLNRGGGITVPGHLWIEIRGNGNDLEQALVPFANAGLSMLPIMCLSANAAIGEPEIELGFDSTSGVTERDYFQCYLSPESTEIHLGRHINVKATVTLINSLKVHPDSERLRRAANQYRLALDYWRLGRESLSLAHLWMALEALTKVKIRAECKSRNLKDEKELAEVLKVDSKQLEPYVRRKLLVMGADECYAKAKKASDGFEHGFLGYDKISAISKDVRHLMAGYVRKAILELCQIDDDTYKTLTKDPFDKPMGYWPVVKYLRGKLIGKGEELAPEGNAYPFMRWKPEIISTEFDKSGKYNMKFKDNLTAELAEGVSFQPKSFEAWQAE